MSAHDIGLSTAIAVVFLGLLFFWRLSWYGSDVIHANRWHKIRSDLQLVVSLRTRPREGYLLDKFGTFFLGGKRVGAELTGHTNWSLCFAFANAIWYFAYLGYTYGPWTFLLQLPWTLAVIGLARYAFHYIDASRNGTVHGFIGSIYGAPTSVLAAVATCIGYVLNCGFEVFYSIHLLAVAFNFTSVELIVAIGTMIFVTACIVAGGYSANVRTDFWKNIFGVLALILLLAFLFPIYAGKFSSIGEALTTPWISSDYNKFPPWHFVLGIFVFAFFFNFVDMANWQSLAANQELSSEQKKHVKKELRWSAYKQLLAPAFLGTALGVMLKVIQPGMNDEEYFKIAFGTAFPVLSIGYGLALGVILLGFISATISSVDNYLLAATQTLAVDVFKRKQAALVISNALPLDEQAKEEREIIDWCKRYMPLLAIGMVIIFALLYYTIRERVFTYQFVMYGAAVTLFPVVVGGLRAAYKARTLDRDSTKTKLGPVSAVWAFLSIFVGLVLVLGQFFASDLVQQRLQSLTSFEIPEAAVTDLTPLSGLVAASIIYCLGIFHRRWRTKR